MSDLMSMIDDTTERLLKKVDNWEVPQSDKKYVTVEELEKVKKERDRYYNALMSIQYETPALGGDKGDMETALCQIDWICNWALRPDEMKEMEKMNGKR